MWPDQVLNPGPLAFESDSLLTALHSPAYYPCEITLKNYTIVLSGGTICLKCIHMILLACNN